MSKLKFFVFVLFMIISVSEIRSQIVINEIMYAPLDANNEWFEIYNNGITPVNLQNWKWKDATSTIRTITTQSIILSANSYLIICQDSNKLKIQFPGINGIISTNFMECPE
ncbi:MAG: lamin tail domain-containing protein [Ignavibacteria bacterium]|nr:lamin tail domain-containing protein [Ignavibacteria bacterium]